MDIKLLDKAIEEFNEENRPARVYFDKRDQSFHTSVYFNNIDMSQSFSKKNFVSVFSKMEKDADMTVNEDGKAYILKYANLVMEGWEPHQIDYELAEMLHHLT